MGAIGVAIAELVGSLVPIIVKLSVGGISEEEARKQSGEAVGSFMSTARASIAADAQRDLETDAKLNRLDEKFDASDAAPEIIK
jgi:hypothetical protein